MELSIVSEEFVKPSSLTPQHLRTHQLSFLDQSASSEHVPITLFYPVGADICVCDVNVDDVFKKRLGLLKQSLSRTLSSFYPLAGRVKDEKSIDCNDEGVYFIEANVKSSLSQVFRQPEFVQKLQPGGAEMATSPTKIIAMVQVTGFACGAMAISASVSHKIADASSLSFFLRSWAASANDDGGIYQLAVPDFDASTRFQKPDDIPNASDTKPPFIKIGRSASTKRFRFDAEAIAALKVKSSSSRCKQKPSRVEAVSALLCKAIAAAVKVRSGIARPIYTTHIVNARRRAMPPFLESCMGNYLWATYASLGMVDDDMELSDLIIKMRLAMTTKTHHLDFVKSWQSETTKFFEFLKDIDEVAAEHIGFNSWCNLGFNDVDFGWGKPMWITTTQSRANFGDSYMNSVFFMDTTSRDGVEAWITLDEDDMAMLQQDRELIAFAALDPNPMI